ncbi:DUF4124 domain-containing protein [Comamonas thiooxydans]|uniref:DUF4124 domain-containing protein n=1 Tax=Comamonas thiooxydans TaxID=363952 RepID=UPI000A2EC438|nr:DUF4124 domain-containing protein [Comamonas thiooxydans]BDR10748.1 DUF4124 domain-containing protein [Comamonas thiooxydans]
MPEPLSPAVTMRKLPLGLLLGWALIAGSAQAQVMRCVDAKTGEVTYTNGRCISGEMSTQIQAAQSAEEIAAERANASQARERSKAQMARDDAQRRQREEQERKEREAADRAQARAGANLENTPACRQARERYNAILAEASPDPATWGERSQAAQAQMEMSCLGAAAYQQLQQSRALQPNAINRPQWGYGHPNRYPPARPTPSQPPAKIVNCNVFRCYDNRGGVHPIP